ncbi:MAG: AEC family transporter, partial [bacterium]|nr:AEC family transporter [bacterium]
MSSFFDAVFPVLAVVGIGYGTALLGGFRAAAIPGLSAFAFNVAVPALLLRSIALQKLPA